MKLNQGFIICNASMKEKILRETSTIQNYIFLTLEELKRKLTFSVKPNATYQLMKHYGFSYSLSLEYIQAVGWIEDKSYSNPKLDSIVSVYHFLKQENLLLFDDLFLFRLKQFPVTFIDPEPTKEYQKIKEFTQKYTEVYEVFPPSNKYTPMVYEFKTIFDEALFVMNQIKANLRKGTSLNQIYIVHSDKNYETIFKRLSQSYGISMEFDSYQNISSAGIVKKFLKECLSQNHFQEVINQLDSSDPLYTTLIHILNDNDLIQEEPKACIPFLKAILKQTNYPKKTYVEAIHFHQEELVFDEKNIVFYVGFNLGASPKIYKEQGFLTDQDLEQLHLSTSTEKNTLAYERLKKWITETPNLKMSYKKEAQTESFFPSLLIRDLNLKVIQNPKIEYGYSKLEDELRLVGLYDLYTKYRQWHEDLNEYGIGDALYKTYDHSYKPISKSLLDEHFVKKPLKLAYSNVKLFFACPFSYFADRILGLNEFKPQMAARMGTFSHAVLEDSYNPDFDFQKSVEFHTKENAVDSKDEFFFGQMTTVLENLLSFNRSHEMISELKTVEREAHIEIVKEEYTFEGFIDKLMYVIKDNEVYAAIIDYKTGADVVSLDNIEDGFHLQLPSYMYLLSKYPQFKDMKLHIIGIYLQKVNIVIFDHKSDIDVQMAKKFMLEGYSVSNFELLKMLDPTYAHSTYIKSLGLGKDGFLKYSKIFLESDQDKIIDMVDHLLNCASSDIHSGNFTIAPKMIRGKNESCTFCKYKDICFMDFKDVVELTHKPFGKGGESNGMD